MTTTAPPQRFARRRLDTVIDVVVTLICVGAATAWSFNLLRVMFSGHTFSNFFELQGRAFLDGDLAIPKGTLGIEAFIRDGHEYMYFGPLPALFRLPILLVTDRLDGRLTVLSMLAGAAVFYWQSNRLLDRILTLLRPVPADADPGRAERWVRLGWRASVAAGTVVLTLLSQPWAYHEAHLWSAAMFVAFLCQALRVAAGDHSRLWLFGLVLLGVALNRPTTSYAALMAGALLVAVLAWKRWAGRRVLIGIGAWTAAAAFTSISINWLKFRRPFGIPMEAQFYSKVDAHRAEMLRIYNNKYFQTEFIPSNLWAYFKPNGVDLSSTFPYIGTPRRVPWVWGDAFYDATYRSASVTATNPLLTIAAVIGVVMFVRMFRRDSFWILAPVVFAGVVAAGGVAGWGYIATRYLTDFLPGMLVFAAIACAGLLVMADDGRLQLKRQLAASARVAAVVLIAWSVLANTAIAFSYAFSAGDSTAEMRRMLSIQDTMAHLGGPSLEDRAVRVDRLRYDRLHPVAPGTLAIKGDCEAVYYSNGEPVDTWLAVEYGNSDWRRIFAVTPSALAQPGDEVELVRLTENSDVDSTDGYWFSLAFVVEEVDKGRQRMQYSFVMRDSLGELAVPELKIPLGRQSRMAITFDKDRRNFFVEIDGVNKLYGHFNMGPLYDSPHTGSRWAVDGHYLPMDITVQHVTTPLCDRLAAKLPS